METKNIIETLLQVEENQGLSLAIDVLHLSPRVHHSLLRAHINTLCELVRNWERISSIKNLGPKSLLEILEGLDRWYSDGKKCLPAEADESAALLTGFVKQKMLFDDLIHKPVLISGDEAHSDIPIEALDLSIRAYNALKRRNMNTVLQIYQQWDKICLYKHIGPATRAEIRKALTSLQNPNSHLKKISGETSHANDFVVCSDHKSELTDNKEDSLFANSVDQLKLSYRIHWLLKKNGIYSIDQITPTRLEELKSRRVLALPTIIEIKKAISIWSTEVKNLISADLQIRNRSVNNSPDLAVKEIEDIDTPRHEVDFEEGFYNFLKLLKPRYISIIEFRFGLRTGKTTTLEETAEHFGVTR